MSNLPSWYDSWLTNDESEAEKQCNCSCIMEWDEKREDWVCPECEKEEQP